MKVTTLFFLGLSGLCFCTSAYADQVTINPLMFNSNIASIPGSATVTQLNANANLLGTNAAKQSVDSSLLGIGSAAQLRDVATTAGAERYATQTSTALGPIGMNDTQFSMMVPSGLRLAGIVNAMRVGLGDTSVSNRALNK